MSAIAPALLTSVDATVTLYQHDTIVRRRDKEESGDPGRAP
jgi:hypothetical protein